MRTWLCKIGLHNWTTREIHQASIRLEDGMVKTAILLRCDCGEAKIAAEGHSMMTRFICPEKFLGRRS